MRIAVNTRFLLKDKLEGYGYYINELSKRIAQQHPEHEFLFVFDRPFDEQFITSQNITPVVVSPQARHALSFKWWYDVKVPFALKKWKADVFVSLDGFCSLTTKVPQVLGIHDLAFLHYPDLIPKHHLWYYKLQTNKFLKKAKHIVTVSEFSKNDIVSRYKVDVEKIEVVHNAARKCFDPIGWEEKEQTKAGWSDGREYFLFVGAIHPRKNIFNLLRAFSRFKQWQQSNMKLLLAGRLAWHSDDIVDKLATYKYRDDVVLLDYVPDEQLSKLVASAYALVYPSLFEGFGLPIVEAMKSGTPVITSSVSSMPEIGGEAALYVDPNDFDNIATQMMRLYKDEQLRETLITAGKLQAEKFNWDRSAEKLWTIIEEASGTKTN